MTVEPLKGFTSTDFARVARAVRRVEGTVTGGPDDPSGTAFPAVPLQLGRAYEAIPPGERGTVKLWLWSPGVGAAVESTGELQALNPFRDAIAVNSIVALAEVAGGGWCVVLESMTGGAVRSFRAPVSLIKGYSETRQFLTHDPAGELEWLDAEECGGG